VGDWEAVSGAVVYGVDTGDADGDADTTEVIITKFDTGLDLSAAYIYALWAEVGGRKSPTATYSVAPATISEPTDFEVNPSYTEADNGVRTYQTTIAWAAQDGVTYTLARADLATYPVPAIGAFSTDLTVPAAIAGRYTVIDTPATRKSYVYRLTATAANGVVSYFDKVLNSDPFREYINESLSVSRSTESAYTLVVELVPNGAYANDLTADIYRAEVPKNLATPPTEDSFTNAVEKTAFVKIKADHALSDDDEYIDSDNLVLGTQYVYRVVYKLGTTELYNIDDDLKGSAGYVRSPTTDTITGVSDAGNNGNSYYFKVTAPGTPLLGSQVQLQSKVDSPTPADPADDWIVVSSSSGVVQIPATATSMPTGSAGLAAGDYYFTITKPSNATTLGNNEYRLVAVNQAGNTANTAYTATDIVSGEVNGW
jgi:hypothetical protein